MASATIFYKRAKKRLGFLVEHGGMEERMWRRPGARSLRELVRKKTTESDGVKLGRRFAKWAGTRGRCFLFDA
jgi:phage-related protein